LALDGAYCGDLLVQANTRNDSRSCFIVILLKELKKDMLQVRKAYGSIYWFQVFGV